MIGKKLSVFGNFFFYASDELKSVPGRSEERDYV
jgi:hypothetical protein